jgi:aspartyl-tRNA(Asn)/glutamyl-tRNA(Gln) amidotransferase subunit A
VLNPRYPDRIPGGSSGGSAAALVAGLCDVALGTDSAGSIRLPAACCGIVGFKPTFGLVPTDGVFPLAPSFDHAGPMALDVETCATLLEALVPGFERATLESLEGVTAAIAWTHAAEPLVRERVEASAELFPRQRRIDFPLPLDFGPGFMVEVADVHRNLFAEHADLYGPSVRVKVERCLAVADDKVEASRRERRAYRGRALEALAEADLLLTPTMAFVAPPVGIGDLALREDMIRLTCPFNSLGWPALALPCGPAEHGLPASLQIVGRPGADALVLGAGALVEAAL